MVAEVAERVVEDARASVMLVALTASAPSTLDDELERYAEDVC
jgi:hypothetical protein